MNKLSLLLVTLALNASALAQQAPSRAPTQTAHLRVYRSRRFVGSALAPSIYVDEVQVARVGDGRRISIKLSAGPHSIRSDDRSSAISLQAGPGQEFFVRVDEAVGFWKGHGKLTLLLPEQGSAEYKLQKPVEDDRRIARNLIEDDERALELGSAPTAAPAADLPAGTQTQTVTVLFNSTPDAADIEIDGSFVGNTPSTVGVSAGQHDISVKKAGFKAWERKINVSTGQVNVNAALESEAK